MSLKSQIEWTDATWNPVRGCQKISPGCMHCYAEVFAERFRGVPGHPYQQGFDLRLVPEKLAEPLLWPSQQMVFVNSMSDLFQVGVPDDYVVAVARVMEKANWHIYQVLTKRANRLAELLSGNLCFAAGLHHIWWGVSVEDRKYGLPRVDLLRSAPAQVRFLSIEPLLEDLGHIDLSGIHWVIVGGESGHGARPMKEEWVQSILEQCEMEGVPFFFKQWGGRQKSKAGRLLNGQTYDALPQIQRRPMSARSERLAFAGGLRRQIEQWSRGLVKSGLGVGGDGRSAIVDGFVATESLTSPQRPTGSNKVPATP
ncbi:MAG: phage Gp37/Gp68 family protein [Acidobacteria bacterium]|nr:phage Gp37/Gp68 family protein [Acidobacteriota bacterium]